MGSAGFVLAATAWSPATGRHVDAEKSDFVNGARLAEVVLRWNFEHDLKRAIGNFHDQVAADRFMILISALTADAETRSINRQLQVVASKSGQFERNYHVPGGRHEYIRVRDPSWLAHRVWYGFYDDLHGSGIRDHRTIARI
jgi:hypothetical protein